MSVQAPATGGWFEKSVPVDAIEHELEQLWRRPSPAEVAEGVPAVGRARVLNLVAYAAEPSATRRVMGVIDRLETRRPSRTIIVVSDEQQTVAGIDATVSAKAQTADGDGRYVLYEQVMLTARGPVGESLPSIIVPLLLPDLPTYLWWPGDPPVGNAFWRRMVEPSDRLILNSGEFTRPLQTLAQYAAFYRATRDFHSFSDLNWTRLEQWCELIAQLFDNQIYRPFLNNIQEVSITYSGARRDDATHPTRALLMAGWLGSRLGWEPIGCQALPSVLRYHLAGRPSGRVVTLQLQDRPASTFAAGTIEAVKLIAKHQGRWATFTVAREEGTTVAHVTIEVEGTVAVHRTVSMVTHDLSGLLGDELERSDQDVTYGSTLATAGTMAEQAVAALV